MAAPYRYLQSDFSAGQIDPMVEANLNFSYKKIGLKESYNTVHNANRTVSKRPGTAIYNTSGFPISTTYGKASIMLPNGKTVMLYFDSTRAIAWYDNKAKDISSSFSIEKGPYHTATYQNFLFVVGANVPLVRSWKFDISNGDLIVTEMLNKWGAKPSCCDGDTVVNFSSCCCAAGRLFLTRGNVVYGSRIRVAGVLVEDSDGFPKWTLDFTLYDQVLETKEVYSSHAIEVRENDMYSSEIKWISYIGRIIVGTESAIFMNTSQVIAPSTFDLVITSSYGTCSVQPEIVNNMLMFLSSDRRKIYSSYYSSDYASLIVNDITANVRNMFASGIEGFYAFDYPELGMYAITNDEKLYYCQPTTINEGMIFAWSEWQLSGEVKPRAFFNARTLSDPYHQICMLTQKGSEMHMETITWKEPYSDDSSRPMLDHMITVHKSEFAENKNIITIDCDSTETLTAFIAADTTAPVVIRNQHTELGKLTLELPKGIMDLYTVKIVRNGNQYPNASTTFDTLEKAKEYADEHQVEDCTFLPTDTLSSTVKVIYGQEYTTRISLFQQILPNNSGVSLSSKHNIKELSVMVFRSFGGYLEVSGRKSADLPYLQYGYSFYSANMYDFATNGAYVFTGVLSLTNPRYRGLDAQNTDNNARNMVQDDSVVIVADKPFAFNLMAVSINYIITEVF